MTSSAPTTGPDPRRIRRARRYEERLLHGGPAARLGARFGLALLDGHDARRGARVSAHGDPDRRHHRAAAPVASVEASDHAIPRESTVVDLRAYDLDPAVMLAARRLPPDPVVGGDEAEVAWQAWLAGREDPGVQLARLAADLARPERRIGRLRPGRRPD